MAFFLDADAAYLFGLIAGRGELSDVGGVKKIIISFPFRNLEATGITKKFTQRDQILISLDVIVNRLAELVGVVPTKVQSSHYINVLIDIPRNSMVWRNAVAFANGCKSYKDIQIPNEMFTASEVIKKEFLRGIADTTGYARASNHFRDGRHRIYLEIHNANWQMPVQLCKLLQDEPLCIPVQTIDWGHPNIRNGQAKEYNQGKKAAWSREHQLKIFAEHFQPIGFRIAHKNEILEEMANYNRTMFPNRKDSLCTPPKRLTKKRVSHPAETAGKLADVLRGKHFDAFWQVCRELGCIRWNPHKKTTGKK